MTPTEDGGAPTAAEQAATVREGLLLLNSMPLTGEAHTESSTRAARQALVALDALVARCEQLQQERDDAVSLLRGCVKADRDDSRMGHPNPGDSCASIHLALAVMPWLAARAALEEGNE